MVAVGWAWLLLCMLFGLAKFKLRFLCWWLPLGAWRDWLVERRWWEFSTTIAFAIIMHPRHGEHVLQHELVHVRQFRDAGLLGALLGLTALGFGDPWLGLVLWLASPLYVGVSYLGSRVGRCRWYLDAEIERSARAQTALVNGKTWLERELDRERENAAEP